MSFADDLATARTNADVSQAQAAEIVTERGVRVAQRTWETWESGKHTPPQKKQALILRILRSLAPDSAEHGGVRVTSAEDGQRYRQEEQGAASAGAGATGEPRVPYLAVPEGAAISHALDYGNGPAVGWDMNAARWIQLGPYGVVKVAASSSVRTARDAPDTSPAAS